MSFCAESETDCESYTTASSATTQSSLALPGLGLYDVICGRDKQAFNCIGNMRFRLTIALNLSSYTTATARKEKSAVIKSIVEIVKSNGGRFLERQGDGWIELNEKRALAKVGHAIRDMVEASRAKEARKNSSSTTVHKSMKRDLTRKPVDHILCPLSINTLRPSMDTRVEDPSRRDSVDSLMLAWLADDSDFLLDTLLENFQSDHTKI